MKLWLLRPVVDLKRPSDPWYPWYDKCHGFIVRAKDEKAAREMAGLNASDETADAWTDPIFSSCVVLPHSGPSKIIMKDFKGA